VHSKLVQHLRDVKESEVERNAPPVLPILGVNVRGIIWAHKILTRSPIQEAGVDIVRPHQEMSVKVECFHLTDDDTSLVDYLPIGVDQPYPRMPIQGFHQHLQHPRQHDIVRGGPSQVLPPRPTKAVVERPGQSLILLIDDGEAIASLIGIENPGRLVGRAIVDDNQFTILPGLVQDAIQGQRKIICLIVGRQHNADTRQDTLSLSIHSVDLPGQSGWS
jgi:hypothetical protein